MAPKRVNLRRPAAGPVRGKRPARSEGEAAEKEESAKKVKLFEDEDPREVARLSTIHLPEANYYGRSIALAGHVKALRSENSTWYLDVEATGTRDEELLRVLTGRADKLVNVHMCGKDCPQLVTDEIMVHAEKFEAVALDAEAWMTNLQVAKATEHGVDELVELRREQERMSKSDEKDAKKKEKKEVKRKKKDRSEEGRESKSPKRGEEEKEVGQKSLEDVFKDTGMDPSPRRRSKILKKARKIAKKSRKGKKKKEKGSSSGSHSSTSSTSSSSSLEVGESGLFEDEKKLKMVWRRCPGALTSRSIQEIKRHLLTASGLAWEMNKSALPPIYLHYGRQVVMPGMSASLQQEVVTVCMTLDLLAQGKIAAGMDVLNQRLKSLESLGRGAHWSMCRQYELVKTEEGGMMEEQEKLAAARQAKEEDRLKALMTRAPSGKGGEVSQFGKSRKGKDSKGGGKNQPYDAGKNKGGQSGKEDPRAAWQKK